MTDEPPAKEIIANLKDDLSAVSASQRIQTMLLTAGVLAFGFMLGAHFMAADLLFGWPLPELERRYYLVMDWGIVVAGTFLVCGVALDFWGEP